MFLKLVRAAEQTLVCLPGFRAEQLKVETQLEQLPAGASDPSALSPPSASSSAAKPAASPQQQRRAIRPLGTVLLTISVKIDFTPVLLGT